jgi:hypothetical protein
MVESRLRELGVSITEEVIVYPKKSIYIGYKVHVYHNRNYISLTFVSKDRQLVFERALKTTVQKLLHHANSTAP